MTASVVIASFGRPKEVRELITQLHEYCPEIEVIVVDQEMSANFSESEIKQWRLTVIDQATANLPRARNTGWKKSKSDVVIFLDDDVVLQPQTIPAHMEAYVAGTVGVAGRVLNSRETLPINTDVETGTCDRFLLNFAWNFWSTRPQEVVFPYGCNMSYRREALKRINGFDEAFLPPLSAFEEVDCAIRAREHGRFRFAPDAVVEHLQTASGGTRLPVREKARSYWYCYGRLLKKHVSRLFLPMVVLRVLPRAFRESKVVVVPFFRGIVS